MITKEEEGEIPVLLYWLLDHWFGLVCFVSFHSVRFVRFVFLPSLCIMIFNVVVVLMKRTSENPTAYLFLLRQSDSFVILARTLRVNFES